MLQQFLNHISANTLFGPTDKVLLAVSGGVDSMVMLDLFKQAGFAFGVAHFNFKLRGKASDEDEAFIRNACLADGIPFYGEQCDTAVYAAQHKLSTQLAARQLRYDFFNTVMLEHGYQYTATAHHNNDNIETFLINFIRGTGLDGLTGIPVKNGNIVRPLLFAPRDRIQEYAQAQGLKWREDASNESDKYQRNLLRHQVMPILRAMNPNLEEVFTETTERLQGAKSLLEYPLNEFRNRAITTNEHQVLVDQAKLLQYAYPAVVLWETIKHFGFRFVQCKEIVKSHQSGKKFLSETHQLSIDRAIYIIHPRTNASMAACSIDRDVINISLADQRLTLHEISVTDAPFTVDRRKSVAQVDLDKIQFPITWRTWRPGDHFIPLGMRQRKKLSDFFIDMKLSIPDKNRVTVLESHGEIVWVVGIRISDKVKVTDQTTRVLRINVYPNGKQ